MEEVDKLPPFFNVFFENVNYKVFVVIDKVRCFRCNNEGHLSMNCPVEMPSAQERLELAKSKDIPSTSSNNIDAIESLLPPFSSRTEVTKIPPDDSVSFPSLTPASPPSAASQCSDITTVTIEHPPCSTTKEVKVLNKETPIPITEVNVDETIIDESSQSSTVSEIKVKKRQCSSSPSKISGSDKKMVKTSQNTELGCLYPLITGYDSSLNATELVYLIEDLKGSKKKLEVITEKYGMDPSLVVSIIDKLAGELSIDKRVKNRLRNLSKGIKCLLDGEASAKDTDDCTSDIDMNDL